MTGAARCPACGKEHPPPTTEFVVGGDAAERLGAFVERAGWRRVVVVADANTDEVCGAALAKRLGASAVRIERVVFPERRGLLADAAAVARVASACAAGVDGALAVGSGTVNDITRAATAKSGVPYCVVPTAASMDGYASSVAALQLDGVKVTVSAHAPLGIFADPAVVAGAPPEMARWGIGDLCGKACANFDWRLGALVTGEPFCAAIAARIETALDDCLAAVPQILAAEPAAVGLLLHGLVASGQAMALQGSSRPASGAEHHVSHLLDLLAYEGRCPHVAHGLQVGYATRFVADLQRVALAGLSAAFVAVPGEWTSGEAGWLSRGEAHLEKVRRDKAEAFSRYAPRWPPPPTALARRKGVLAEAVAHAGPVNAALADAGIPRSAPFAGVDEPTLRGVLRYANRMRNRFTALDLLEAQGRLDAAIDTVLAMPAA